MVFYNLVMLFTLFVNYYGVNVVLTIKKVSKKIHLLVKTYRLLAKVCRLLEKRTIHTVKK